MTKIIQNVDLADLAPGITGYETCAASAFDIALYTGNIFAAFSTDGGNTFQTISLADMMKKSGDKVCCDQRVEYIPSIQMFAWVLLGRHPPDGNGTLVLAWQNPEIIKITNGTHWRTTHITPRAFGLPDDFTFDYPQLSVGSSYLYLTADVVGPGDRTAEGAVICRFPLSELEAALGDVSLWFQYRRVDQWYVCPCHNAQFSLGSEVGWFATLLGDSFLRVYSWDEGPGELFTWFDVGISTIATQDFSSFTPPPDGDNWLAPTSKIHPVVTGARSNDRLLLAWSAGRNLPDGSPSKFPHPHIEMALINLRDKILETQRYIWHPDFAFAWPSLAANQENPGPEIGISFNFGGGRKFYPQHAVGQVYPFMNPFLPTTNEPRTSGAGGHYNDVRMNYPEERELVAAGFVQTKDDSTPPKLVNRPHFVKFRP